MKSGCIATVTENSINLLLIPLFFGGYQVSDRNCVISSLRGDTIKLTKERTYLNSLEDWFTPNTYHSVFYLLKNFKLEHDGYLYDIRQFRYREILCRKINLITGELITEKIFYPSYETIEDYSEETSSYAITPIKFFIKDNYLFLGIARVSQNILQPIILKLDLSFNIVAHNKEHLDVGNQAEGNIIYLDGAKGEMGEEPDDLYFDPDKLIFVEDEHIIISYNTFSGGFSFPTVVEKYDFDLGLIDNIVLEPPITETNEWALPYMQFPDLFSYMFFMRYELTDYHVIIIGAEEHEGDLWVKYSINQIDALITGSPASGIPRKKIPDGKLCRTITYKPTTIEKDNKVYTFLPIKYLYYEFEAEDFDDHLCESEILCFEDTELLGGIEYNSDTIELFHDLIQHNETGFYAFRKSDFMKYTQQELDPS